MPPEIWTIISDGGGLILGPLFAWMWWVERGDRKTAEAKIQTMATENGEVFRQLFEKANGGAQ